MAVYTEVSDEALKLFVDQYDIGQIQSCKGIAEGVENSNYHLQTNYGSYILTLYEKRVNPEDLPFFLGLMDYLAEKDFPCPVPIHGRDGESMRILNGKPRRPHYGIDFHAPEGTPVKAMMDGEVTLAENDMYFTGGTIIFDHGHGISTLYMHMKDINVKIGQKIKKGQIVGTLGQSGRATGPHLDIRLNWFDVKLDPATILN